MVATHTGYQLKQNAIKKIESQTNNVVFDGFKKHNNSITQTRASAEGLPSELAEDSKFVPLNADDPTYGPPALLLLGFEVSEAEKIRQFLKELDGDFMEIIYCTEDMINGSLWEAVNTRQPNLEQVKIAKSLPRICFFSGLSGEEMMMFIDAFPETGLEPAVFAALVPNSADKPVAELIDEIMGDHEMLTAQQSGST
ncbi:Vacuolar acid trehalase [Gossypium arboreum]|uniref:Vacuolar acid trehalase n=1 Tax=Gossypium arboreum TaxID=29729 RepID=A0A0B0MYS5_GOSAR|nr:Vacuolar acid trehalase [Gossypium arboreum]